MHVSWVAIPWTIVGLFGTATAFIVGFKNSQSYNRIWEAQQIWVSISSNSKAWGITCRDYLKNPALRVLGLQSEAITNLYDDKEIPINFLIELEKSIKEFIDLQGKSERIKNFPYPRQFSVINGFFINLFCFILPFGILKEFDKLNESVNGFMHGYMVWLVIPFSIIISWMYTSLTQVGESSENPFEGSPNDIPISQMSRNVEIDLREMLGEIDLPSPLQPKNNIIL